MSDYVILFPADDEAAWQAGTEADHRAVYDADAAFIRLLEERGGRVTGGRELGHSSRSRTIRRGPNGTALVTDGPFAESAEQLSGFYLVTCPEYDALVAAAEPLLRAHPAVEIRTVEG
jgi:hypothetical protein